jgi:hypothetical protein
MGIETLGAALRQLNHSYADGVVAGLSKAEVLERYPALGGRRGLRRPGGAARATGTGPLPRDLAVTDFVSSVLMGRGVCRGISR